LDCTTQNLFKMARKYISQALMLTFCLCFTHFALGAPKKCKCNEDAIFNRESANPDWNKYIHEACAAIQNKDYDAAHVALKGALAIGEDSYIQGLYECVKTMKGITGETITPAKEVEAPKIAVENNSEVKEEAKMEPDPLPVPVKEAAKEPEAPASAPEPVASTEELPEIMTDDVESKEESRVFSAEELASFQAKGMLKVNTFSNYLGKIGNKKTTQNEGLAAINNAMKLFYGDTYVQVSSTKSDVKSKHPTRTYLERVRALKYDQVEIEWAECQYASNLRKAPDGNYYGYIKFRQRFKGIRDNKVVYEDITDKTIAVVLRAYDKAIEGETVENFDIFLGDIDVLQTMKN